MKSTQLGTIVANSATCCFVVISLSLAMAAVASPANAAVIAYTNRTLWQTAVGPLSGTENFNSFVVDTSFKTSPVALTNMTVIGTTGSNGTQSQLIDVSPFQFSGSASWDTTPYLFGDLEGATQFLRFTFTTPVIAWGGDTVGYANPPRNTRIDLFDASNTLLGSVVVVGGDNTTRSFVGFALTAGAASSAVFVNTYAGNDAFGLDNIGFVTIPEPTGLLSVLVAAVGVSLLFRRETVTSKSPQ